MIRPPACSESLRGTLAAPGSIQVPRGAVGLGALLASAVISPGAHAKDTGKALSLISDPEACVVLVASSPWSHRAPPAGNGRGAYFWPLLKYQRILVSTLALATLQGHPQNPLPRRAVLGWWWG